ncbi:chemotaxis protein CheB [Kribbella sp. NPDC051770]|uniref:chemotaxis protein CheB n=1 Tax=Kribbella sp. NPDC051770 TaxID=3155413 RepID=UPI00344365A1
MMSAATSRDLVVIGASAGGVEALRSLVSQLPADLPAAVLVVLHLPAGSTSVLATILDDAGRLPAEPAEHGAPIHRGRLYVAQPDHHLLLDGDRQVMSSGPTENGHRPAVNALFRSAALARGPLVAGIVLSGVLDDGTAGLAAIKARGGLAIVQDPDDAAYRGMPDNALAAVAVDHVLPAAAIGEQLAGLLGVPVDPVPPAEPDPLLRYEHALALSGVAAALTPSPASAPQDCSARTATPNSR